MSSRRQRSTPLGGRYIQVSLYLASSAQELQLLAVIRYKALCQAPPPWRHNAIPPCRHIYNITSFRNLELDTLGDVKTTSKYWLSFVFLVSWDKNKTMLLRDTVNQTSFRSSAAGTALRSTRRLLTPLGISCGSRHVKTQCYHYIAPRLSQPEIFICYLCSK